MKMTYKEKYGLLICVKNFMDNNPKPNVKGLNLNESFLYYLGTTIDYEKELNRIRKIA